MKVLVVGSMAYDSVETWAGKVEHALGGSATFFSLSSSLFASTEVVAVIGDDFRATDLDRLQVKGVGLDGVQQVAGKTFRWGGRYSRYFETRETLFTELNVFSDFKPQIPEHLKNSEVVFLANIHPALQLEVLNQVTAPKFVALDTMNFWIEGALDDLKAVLTKVDLLMVNDEEAFALSGVGNLVEAAEKIVQMGPKAVVIKRGEHGAWLFAEGAPTVVPAVALRRVVDPTGAGDTFAGGFIGYLARAGSFDQTCLEQAMVSGTLAASYCVEDFSVDRLEQVTLDDLRTRHAQLAATVTDLVVDL
ncbi:MAG TPA: sugar kinase [Myxococcales bacterium]|nr:sugar kinase [Myxococcales bacterium]HAN31235.1 sugar kinase [Myxococcales bacterium]